MERYPSPWRAERRQHLGRFAGPPAALGCNGLGPCLHPLVRNQLPYLHQPHHRQVRSLELLDEWISFLVDV